ncbi:unnamed protein product [Lactuca saligna]|uniref:Uncharacterized protein n=1 Tax=Lactuca saligna TaxID=75948 RepID=A0AA35YUZ9_LACSI|nr:unnamed protein product [Lactuca saligna]
MHASLKAFMETDFASYLQLGELDMEGLHQLCNNFDAEDNQSKGSFSKGVPSTNPLVAFCLRFLYLSSQVVFVGYHGFGFFPKFLVSAFVGYLVELRGSTFFAEQSVRCNDPNKISSGRTTSVPYVKMNGVSQVLDLRVVRYD